MKVAAITAVIIWLVGWSALLVFQTRSELLWRSIRVIQCDVGQGDAILITRGYLQLLIDAGPDAAVLECLKQSIPWNDRQLEVVLATHEDADHIGGFTDVFGKYQIRTIWLTNQQKDTDQAKNFQKMVKELGSSGTQIIYAQAGQSLEIGREVSGEIWWPAEKNLANNTSFLSLTETQLSALQQGKNGVKDSYNDGSIVLFIKIYNTKLLLMGDTEEKTEIALRDRGMLANIDVIKAGHHGSKSSSTAEFLQFLQPEVALIGVGKGNRYGHPDQGVLQRFAEQGVAVWRTDVHGSVQLTITQEGYTIRPSRRDQNGDYLKNAHD